MAPELTEVSVSQLQANSLCPQRSTAKYQVPYNLGVSKGLQARRLTDGKQAWQLPTPLISRSLGIEHILIIPTVIRS